MTRRLLKRVIILMLALLPLSVYAQLQGPPLLDSLMKELPQAKTDSAKVKILNNLSFNYSNISPDTGLKYASIALDLSEKAGYQKGIASSYSSFSVNYTQQSDYPKALEYCFKSLKIYEALDDKKDIAANLGNIANCYLSEGDFAKAMEYQLKDLKIAEKIGNVKQIASCEMNIANIYAANHDYEKAKEFLFSALKKEQSINNKMGIENCLINLGGTYFSEKDYKGALTNYSEALKISEALGDKSGLAVVKLNIGCSYRELNDFPNALQSINMAVVLSKELGDNGSLAMGLNELGSTYVKMSQTSGQKEYLNTAIKNMEEALVYMKDINDPAQVASVYSSLTDAYELSGRYKDALKTLKTYQAINDSLFSTDNKIKMANLRTQREMDLKEEQIQVNKIQHSKERNERIFYIIGICLLLLVLAIILSTYNRQKRTNIELNVVNKRLEDEKSKSDMLAMYLQDSLREKDEVATKLAALINMKSRFFGNISHELRTPVTLIAGMLEMMKDKKGTDSDKELVEVAYNNSRKLQHMIEEMLDLSRVENKIMAVNSEVKEICPILKRMVCSFESIIHKQELKLIYDDAAARHTYISIDDRKFEKIINNLIYNALKFNKKQGLIQVTVSLSPNKEMLVIEVKDTGIGIDPQDLPHIFERFYQASSDSKTMAEGVGIGLSLVKEFTLLLNGTIDVTSSVGIGTKFVLQFPVADHKPQEVKEETLQVTDNQLKINDNTRNTILIVEDNADMRFYLKEVLGRKVQIAEAGNGKEALAWLEHNKPDLIISDMMMPEMGGKEFITRLKLTDTFSGIPIITLTALADMENQLSMLQIGIDDYIVKPFNADELRIRVQNLLQNFAARKQFIEEIANEPEVVVLANQQEASEFREKIKAYVLSKIGIISLAVSDIALELGYSERQLYRYAKSLTGCTPAQLIKEIRLMKAYELLTTNQVYKIDDLAKRVGYEHVSYFSTQFFERFGKRPSEYL